MLDIRFKQLSDTVKNAVSIGKSVNTLRAELKATKGAAASLICKLYRKFKQALKANAVTITASKLSASLFIVVSNTTSVAGAKVLTTGRMLALSHFEAFQRVYGFNLIIQ